MSYAPPRAPAELLTITQLCRQTGATPRALRYYEQMGLLSPRRRHLTRLYSRREKARLLLIQSGRRAGLTLRQIGDLFETYDKAGRHAQLVQALPLLQARLVALEQKRGEIDEALHTLTAAADHLTAKLGARAPDGLDGLVAGSMRARRPREAPTRPDHVARTGTGVQR